MVVSPSPPETAPPRLTGRCYCGLPVFDGMPFCSDRCRERIRAWRRGERPRRRARVYDAGDVRRMAHLYYDRLMSDDAVGRIYGVKGGVVRGVLRRAGYVLRDRIGGQEARAIRGRKGRHLEYRSRRWLEHHYVERGWSTREMALVARVSQSTICRWLAAHGIGGRPKTARRRGRHWDRAWLVARYHGDGLSVSRIAARCGRSRTAILHAMRRLGVPRRSGPEAARLRAERGNA